MPSFYPSMSLKLKIVNPLKYEDWDNMILSCPGYSFFHSSAWARVLYEAYHYTPLYFLSANSKKLNVLVPLMEIKSLVTGRRGVSLPFSDFCAPVIENDIDIDDVLNYIIDFGKSSRWKHVEFRPGKELIQKTNPSKIYHGHILSLNGDENQLFSAFRDSTKRNIKKSIKKGVEVKICNSLKSMKDFYRLNCITRKYHGLPPQPWHFFMNVFKYIISSKTGVIVLAMYQNRVIAGNVYFFLGGKALYKYGASDKKFQHLRPNDLVMWKAIEWLSQNGFKSLDLGKTVPDNKGLLQFKRGWRGEEETIYYYKYDLRRDVFVKDNLGIKSSYKIFKALPSPLLKTIGSILYRHVG
jgi:hypothetical protein